MKGRSKVVMLSVIALAVAACSTQSKLQRLKRNAPSAQIAISQDRKMPESVPRDIPQQDTLVIRNIDGRDMIIMRAIKDDDGQTVANQVLEAARVTARFRNVAERHGKVDIEFQIIVPEGLQDSKWQLRYDPVMYIMQDTISLDKVVITGRDYRKRQLRGYQQYRRFLDRIISDTSRLIHMEALEIFIRRNIPQLYAFRSDTTFVSDEQFDSVFGITQQMAVEHYTDKFARWLNDYRIASKDRMFRKYVKAPIITEGIRLDTVMAGEGEYIYNYIQTIATRPGLKKAGIMLSGALFEQDRKLCDIAASDVLNFYISSLSAFVDDREKYITKVIERKAEANYAYDIAFISGGCEINPGLADNAHQISDIKVNLHNLMLNDVFELDSVIVTASASPEGGFSYNQILSRKRGLNVAAYFGHYMRGQIDSVNNERGVVLNLDSEFDGDGVEALRPVPFTGRSLAEDWAGLDNLVETDSLMTPDSKKAYDELRNIRDLDLRESRMKAFKWYAYLKNNLYPMLRKVRFQFHLHRRGMTKDTIQTTVLDTVYMKGIQAVKDRDYSKAVELLMPYGDYNTAVAYCALDRNKNALGILLECEKTAQVNYMLALLYSREGDDRQAVEYYLRSCSQNPQYVHRGNLDPEISRLIKSYALDERISQY